MSPLPSIHTPLTAQEVAVALETEARRGRLAGWTPARPDGTPGQVCRFEDFGTPFESEMSVVSERAEPRGSESGTLLRFESRIRPRMPWVWGVVLALTVWPGVTLTDSLLRTYWTGYDYQTWMWYLPLTAPWVPPAMWSAWKKSKATGAAAARELIASIAQAVKGRVIEPTKGD